jgi:hypothetical protein
MKAVCLHVAAILSLTLSSVAYAQDVPAQTPPEGPVPSSEPTPLAPPPPPPVTEPTPVEGGHFRWGLSPSIGTFFPGPTTLAFGFEGRFGYSFNPDVSLYGGIGAVAGLGIGGSSDVNGTSFSVSAVTYWYLDANVDTMLAGPLFVGGGVGFGRGAFAIVKATSTSSGAGSELTAASGLMPQLNARIGLTTGKVMPATGKRSGFSIALDLRMLIAPSSTSTVSSASSTGGSSSVQTDTTAIGFSPMLLIGYESR